MELTEKRYIIETPWMCVRATLIHTIPARQTPDPLILARHFPPLVPRSYLEPSRHARNIFATDGGSTLIFPDNDTTRSFIKEVQHEKS